MLASCLWIVTEAVRRLFFREHLALAFSPWPFLVLLLSITVDFTRARTLHRTAREFHSLALEADAIHFSTDIWSSSAVLLGLAATYLGERLHIAALTVADPIAALLVAGIILRVTIRLARRTIDNLLDATPTHNPKTAAPQTPVAISFALSPASMVSSRSTASASVSPALASSLTSPSPCRETLPSSAPSRSPLRLPEPCSTILPEADVVIHSIPTASKAESLHDRDPRRCSSLKPLHP